MPKIVDKEQKRVEIARKTMPLIAKLGFDKTPVRKIAAEVGIGKGTFYDYFSSKEDILNEIIRLVFSDWTKLVISKIAGHQDPLEKLGIMIKEAATLNETFEQNMIIYLDLWRWAVSKKGSDDFSPKFQTYLETGKNGVRDLIQEAQSDGFIKKDIDASSLAIALIALIDGLCMHSMILKPDFNIDQISQVFFESLLKGIEEG